MDPIDSILNNIKSYPHSYHDQNAPLTEKNFDGKFYLLS